MGQPPIYYLGEFIEDYACLYIQNNNTDSLVKEQSKVLFSC